MFSTRSNSFKRYFRLLTSITRNPLQLGNLAFSRVIKANPDKYIKGCDRSADKDDTIPFPDTLGKHVSVLKQRMLQDTSPWLSQPDYQRVIFINSIMELLWPHLSPAIHKEALKQAKAPLDDICKKVKVLQDIRIDKLDLGTRPFRVDSFKIFKVVGNEMIIECPVFWGADLHVRVTAVLKSLGIYFKSIDVPIDVANVQFKALMRITIKPLVETLPCFGGVTLSLLEEPIVNCDVHIADSPDVMALPGVPLMLKAAIKIITGRMLVYPNEFSVPLMPNYGLPPPILGLLKVKVLGADGLKSSFLDTVDAFAEAELAEGHEARTRTIENNVKPEWNETLEVLVHDPLTQQLKVSIKDEDMFGDELLGFVKVPLADAEFMATPRQPVVLDLTIVKEVESAIAARAVGAGVGAVTSAAAGTTGVVKGAGKAGGGLFHKVRAMGHKKKKAAADGESTSVSSEQQRTQTSDAAASSTLVIEEKGEEVTSGGVHTGHKKKKDKKKNKDKPTIPTGQVRIEVTFLPLQGVEIPISNSMVTSETGKEAKQTVAASVSMIKRTLTESFLVVNPLQHGVLAVGLKKATGLEKAMDTYATIKLYDPNRLPIPDIERRSAVVFNESSPRYNMKVDFVNVSAASTVTITIFAAPGLMDHLTKIPFKKKQAKVLGKVRIPASSIVKEESIVSVFPLAESESGEAFLSMRWNALDLTADEPQP